VWQFLREAVPVIGGLMGFVSAWFTWIDRRERKDKERAAEQEAANRKAWCEEMREKLVTFSSSTIMSIKPERIEWARWGASQGYFHIASNDPMQPSISRHQVR
jgi:hypothetical protein